MNDEYLIDYLSEDGISVVDAMAKIDTNAKGILFIVDSDRKLLGCVTDGDIRRWILKTGDLHANIKNAMKKNPLYIRDEERKAAESIMIQNSVIALPVIDDNNCIEDIVFLSHFSKKSAQKHSLAGVPVVIMAGGKGTRLFPYTKILPKPLIPIGETPIVERIIDYYCEYGIDSFYMTVNYKKAMIKSYFADINTSYKINYVEENKPLGTGGSIALIEDTLTEPIFITNCDALILADYDDIYKFHKESGNLITVVSALKNITIPYGVLKSGSGGDLISMEEKPRISYLINTGMYMINPSVIDLIPHDEMFHMTQLVEKVMNTGGKVGTYPISEDSFLDMGEFDELKRMEEYLNSHV